jgi:hypothetical protein
MAQSAGLHEPEVELSVETIDRHRAFLSTSNPQLGNADLKAVAR